jgi:hypothetical protein
LLKNARLSFGFRLTVSASSYHWAGQTSPCSRELIALHDSEDLIDVATDVGLVKPEVLYVSVRVDDCGAAEVVAGAAHVETKSLLDLAVEVANGRDVDGTEPALLSVDANPGDVGIWKDSTDIRTTSPLIARNLSPW